MLDDGGQGNRERGRELGDGKLVCVGQPIDDGPPGRIGERGEGTVEGVAVIVNHVVKYCEARANVKPPSAQACNLNCNLAGAGLAEGGRLRPTAALAAGGWTWFRARLRW
jgi:hypothetical protein